MAASFTIAARNNGLTEADGRTATLEAVRAYREAMTRFAGMGVLETWYGSRISEDDLQAALAALADHGSNPKHGRHKRKDGKGIEATAMAAGGSAESAAQRAETKPRKARTRDSLQALSKLGEMVDGRYRIVSQPPLIVPLRDLEDHYGMTAETVDAAVRNQFREFRSTLEGDRRDLLERFEVIDVARKVVGVGSVGTRAFIVLLQGRDERDPLFLQMKEATNSVLEDHLPKSRYHNPGERVVRGQRILQAASDIFLGWTTGLDTNRTYYWRQLRDMKASAASRTDDPDRDDGLRPDVRVDARPGPRPSRRPDRDRQVPRRWRSSNSHPRLLRTRYADQNQQDYEQFVKAIRSGRIEATEGV